MATNFANILQGQDLMTGLQARDVRLGTVSGSRRVHWMLFGVTMLSLFCFADLAQSQPPVRQGRWMRGEGPRWQRFGRRQGERRFGMSRFERTIDSGHLFLEGEYISSPFEVTFENEELRINDVVVPVSTDNYVAMEDEDEDLLLDEGDGPARRRRRPQVPRDVMNLVQTLQSDGVVVALPGNGPVAVDPDAMFQTLISEDRTAYLDELLQYLPPTADRSAMVEWVQSYEPPAGLVEFASNWVESRDRAEAVNMASINAVRRLNQFAYPLSIFGMIIGAMSAGHLLSWRPTVAGSGQETDASPLALRMLNRVDHSDRAAVAVRPDVDDPCLTGRSDEGAEPSGQPVRE